MFQAMRFWAVLLGLSLSSCGAGAPAATLDAAPQDAATRDAGAGAVDGSHGALDATHAVDASKAPCSEPPSQRPDGGTCVVEAKGDVTDLEGDPLAKLVMTFCGAECFGALSDSSGHYVIDVGLFIDSQDFAIHADGRPNHAVDYLRLHAGEPRIVSASMHLPTLPPSTVSLPPDGAPASSVTEGDLTLVVAAGTKFDLDIEDFGKPKGRLLRVADVPLVSAPSYAKTAKVAAIYALAPSGATSSVKMGVTLKNSAALPASAAVDVMVLGDDYFSVPPNVGLLQVAASAHVSADGTTIQTDPGEGITKITWLAVRQKGI
jgi:hypothetical protein